MADISAFPAITKVLQHGDNIVNLTAGAALTAGQVVGAHETGVSGEVIPHVAGAAAVVGVSLYDVASGGAAAIASVGCIVTVANADDTTAIDAGHWVTVDDNAVGGTVSVIVATLDVVGITIDDIAGGGTGRVLIMPSPNVTP